MFSNRRKAASSMMASSPSSLSTKDSNNGSTTDRTRMASSSRRVAGPSPRPPSSRRLNSLSSQSDHGHPSRMDTGSDELLEALKPQRSSDRDLHRRARERVLARTSRRPPSRSSSGRSSDGSSDNLSALSEGSSTKERKSSSRPHRSRTDRTLSANRKQLERRGGAGGSSSGGTGGGPRSRSGESVRSIDVEGAMPDHSPNKLSQSETDTPLSARRERPSLRGRGRNRSLPESPDLDEDSMPKSPKRGGGGGGGSVAGTGGGGGGKSLRRNSLGRGSSHSTSRSSSSRRKSRSRSRSKSVKRRGGRKPHLLQRELGQSEHGGRDDHDDSTSVLGGISVASSSKNRKKTGGGLRSLHTDNQDTVTGSVATAPAPLTPSGGRRILRTRSQEEEALRGAVNAPPIEKKRTKSRSRRPVSDTKEFSPTGKASSSRHLSSPMHQQQRRTRSRSVDGDESGSFSNLSLLETLTPRKSRASDAQSVISEIPTPSEFFKSSQPPERKLPRSRSQDGEELGKNLKAMRAKESERGKHHKSSSRGSSSRNSFGSASGASKGQPSNNNDLQHVTKKASYSRRERKERSSGSAEPDYNSTGSKGRRPAKHMSQSTGMDLASTISSGSNDRASRGGRRTKKSMSISHVTPEDHINNNYTTSRPFNPSLYNERRQQLQQQHHHEHQKKKKDDTGEKSLKERLGKNHGVHYVKPIPFKPHANDADGGGGGAGEDDIFSFYTWSTKKKNDNGDNDEGENTIAQQEQRRRQRLSALLRQGAMLSSYKAYVQ